MYYSSYYSLGITPHIFFGICLFGIVYFAVYFAMKRALAEDKK